METNQLSLKFQFFSLAFTAAVIVFLFMQETRRVCSVDKKPQLFSLTPSTLQKFAATPTLVRTGITITDFPEFSVEQNKFIFSGVVWFVFEPSLISLDTIGKFSFLKGDIESKSPPLTRLEGGKLVAEYQVRVAFKTNLYYGFFPLDDHTIYLALVNREVNPGEIIFESTETDFVLSDDIYISGWTYTDHHVSSGYGTIQIGSGLLKRERFYPEVLYGIHFLHESMRYIISILLPLLIVFFIDLFTFCLDQKIDQGVLVSVSTGNIVALVAYRFIIESMAPQVGYLLLSDYAFFIFLTNTFVVFIINCMGLYLTVLQKKIVSISLQLVVITVFLFLFQVWIPC
ncbi:hypothetical protein H0X06_04110 [Candidatus Dependentiae bacterium]|nr:hypothetical protein [Candidatus Dependentiae bacterium]